MSILSILPTCLCIWPTNLETVHHFGDAAACFGLPSRLYNVLLSEALMPVPPGPAQPGSAPVFGRYAGVQGVQMCPSAARRGFYYVFEACFPLGAPPDVGFKKRLVFIGTYSVSTRYVCHGIAWFGRLRPSMLLLVPACCRSTGTAPYATRYVSYVSRFHSS